MELCSFMFIFIIIITLLSISYLSANFKYEANVKMKLSSPKEDNNKNLYLKIIIPFPEETFSTKTHHILLSLFVVGVGFCGYLHL